MYLPLYCPRFRWVLDVSTPDAACAASSASMFSEIRSASSSASTTHWRLSSSLRFVLQNVDNWDCESMLGELPWQLLLLLLLLLSLDEAMVDLKIVKEKDLCGRGKAKNSFLIIICYLRTALNSYCSVIVDLMILSWRPVLGMIGNFEMSTQSFFENSFGSIEWNRSYWLFPRNRNVYLQQCLRWVSNVGRPQNRMTCRATVMYEIIT